MSAAVVSTSVIGSAATTIHRGRGSARGEPPDLLAERPGVGEDQRRVEPEDARSPASARLGIARDVVVARQPLDPAEHRLVRPPRAPEHVEDRQRDGDPMPGQHAEQRHAEERRHRQGELGPALLPEPDRARDVGERQRGGDHHGGQGRLGQVPEQPGHEQQHQRDGAGARPVRPPGSSPRPARPPRSASRWCSPGSPGTDRPRGSPRRSRSSPGCRRPPGRCGRRTPTPSRSCPSATPARCRARRATSGPRSRDATVGMVNGGNPCGSAPTSDTPWSPRSKTPPRAMASDDRDQHAGDLGQPPLQHQDAATRPTQRRSPAAAGTVSPSATPSTNPFELVDEPVGVDGEPEQLGQLADEDRQREPVHVADLGRLGQQVGDEPELRGARRRS